MLASLAACRTKAPLEIWLYEPNEELLDLFERLGRTFFAVSKARHSLIATLDPREALDDATAAIFQCEEASARLSFRLEGKAEPDDPVDAFRRQCRSLIVESTEWLDLPDSDMGWPPALDESDRVSRALQVLRLLSAEDEIFPFLHSETDTLLTRWVLNQLCL